MAKRKPRRKVKPTRRQRQAKEQAAQARKRDADKSALRKERAKRIFTIVVCAILALALCIPTMALAVLSS